MLNDDDDYKAISILSTEYDAGISTEYTSSIRSNRSLLKFILLSIITCGLYSLYFFNLCGRDLNLIAMNDGRKTSNFFLVFFCSLLLLAVFGTFPIYYFITHGGEIPAISSPSFVKIVHFTVMFALLVITLLPMLIWFHNFSSRVDNELQKRKTTYRFPPFAFWIFACVLPLVFSSCNIIFFLLSDTMPNVWVTSSVHVICGIASFSSMMIYLSFVIFDMNILAQCAIYRNVEFR